MNNSCCDFDRFHSRRRCMAVLSGTVVNFSGPAADVVIHFCVNGFEDCTVTDDFGNYCIRVPLFSEVLITVETATGVTVTPTDYHICPVRSDVTGLDFVIRSTTSVTFRVSGTVSGLPDNSEIPVTYTVNGNTNVTHTDDFGNYSFDAIAGSEVVIQPSMQTGFTVAPANYLIVGINMDMPGKNFVYTPIV